MPALARRNYREFLKSAFWKKLSERAKAAGGGRCCRCGLRSGLEAHHKFYRDDWYETKVEDLEVLCRGCHGAEHGIDEREFLPDVDLDIAFERFHDLIKGVSEKGWGLERQDRKFIRRTLERWPEHGGVAFKVALLLYYDDGNRWPESDLMRRESINQLCERIRKFYVRPSV